MTWYADEFDRVGDLRSIFKSKGVSPKKIAKLNSLIGILLTDLKSSLSFDYFARSIKPEDIYSLLVGNVTKVVSAYMDLWVFIAKTYGANDKFREEMECLQEKLESMKPQNP